MFIPPLTRFFKLQFPALSRKKQKISKFRVLLEMLQLFCFLELCVHILRRDRSGSETHESGVYHSIILPMRVPTLPNDWVFVQKSENIEISWLDPSSYMKPRAEISRNLARGNTGDRYYDIAGRWTGYRKELKLVGTEQISTGRHVLIGLSWFSR